MTTATWTILGIEESDGEHCECCGACCPRRRVVLTDGEREVRFGSSCAALRLIGDKKAGSVKTITEQARAVGLARKWLAAGHAAEVVAKGIWNRFGFLTEARSGGVQIHGVGLIA